MESKITKASSSINEYTDELLENTIGQLNLNDDNENDYFFCYIKPLVIWVKWIIKISLPLVGSLIIGMSRVFYKGFPKSITK